MDRKAGPPVQVKVVDEGKGQVEAVFSRLNVIDKDGDVTRPGAFGEQKVRISAFNHQSWNDELPIGKGTIHETDAEAILKGQFFMETTKGRETFLTIKELGDLMEWSYGFDILERAEGKWPDGDENGQNVRFLDKLKVHEVSPVILGAGVDTRTLSAKGDKGAIGYSETGTTDVNWDVGMMRRRITAAQSPLRAAHAWVDNSGDPNAKSSYKFLHHMVSENGAVGAANTRACVATIAILNGGRGGSNIPDGDRNGVYSHVAHHIRDAGGEAPPLKSKEEIEKAWSQGNVELYDHVAWICAEYDEMCVRVADVMAMRADKGKQLSDPIQEMIKSALSSSDRLREVLASEPRDNPNQRQLAEQILRDSRALLFLTGGSQ
jgi:Caudovirus prohead serine protease